MAITAAQPLWQVEVNKSYEGDVEIQEKIAQLQKGFEVFLLARNEETSARVGVKL